VARIRNTPVEAFGPKLMALLMKGALEKVELPMSWNRAVRLRQRIYQLRTAMKSMTPPHDKYSLVARVRITIEQDLSVPMKRSGNNLVPVDGKSPARLVLRPNDSEFDDVLDTAGVTIHEPIVETAAESSVPDAPDQMSVLEDILKDL